MYAFGETEFRVYTKRYSITFTTIFSFYWTIVIMTNVTSLKYCLWNCLYFTIERAVIIKCVTRLLWSENSPEYILKRKGRINVSSYISKLYTFVVTAYSSIDLEFVFTNFFIYKYIKTVPFVWYTSLSWMFAKIPMYSFLHIFQQFHGHFINLFVTAVTPS